MTDPDANPTPDPRIEVTDEMLDRGTRASWHGPPAYDDLPPSIRDGRRQMVYDILAAALDALGPMVPLARAQEEGGRYLGRSAEEWAEIVGEKAASEDSLLERALRAEEAARDYANGLASIKRVCEGSWRHEQIVQMADRFLNRNPGFLPNE